LLDNSWIELAISAAELGEQFGEDGGFAALIKIPNRREYVAICASGPEVAKALCVSLNYRTLE